MKILITRVDYRAHGQQGSVLLISLIFLVLLTLLAISAMNSTSLEERMASNSHEYTLSFDATEAALLDAEWWLNSVQVAPQPVSFGSCTPATCPTGWITPSTVAQDPTGALANKGCDGQSTLWDTTKTGPDVYCDLNPGNFWGKYGTPLGTATTARTLPALPTANQPMYIVEFELAQPITGGGGITANNAIAANTYFYQITARGLARGTSAIVIAQSTFAIDK